MRYGIRIEDFDRMWDEQKGRCAVCREPMQRPCVDHNHETGEVRKLLCHGCNVLVGYLETRRDTLEAAFRYLSFSLTLNIHES